MHAWKVLCENKGGVAILVGVSMVVLLSVAAFAVDYGFGLVARNELKNVADAAALAGTRCLGAIYAGKQGPGAHPCSPATPLTPTQQQNYVLSGSDRAAIVAQVQNVAQKNTAGGKSITIANTDISVGQWDLKAQSLTVTDTRPTAVEVTARRDGVANGPISTFFANIMGITTANVTSTSVNTVSATVMHPTAALTGVSHVEPGGLTIPVGISQQWFANNAAFCNQNIQFYPTNTPTGCAGWNTFEESPANASTLSKEILQKLPPLGTYETPDATVGTTSFTYIGGNVASALDDLYTLFDKNATPDATSPTGRSWKIFVPVYQSTDCKNPSGSLPIVGFATAFITDVQCPSKCPTKGQLVQAKVECNLIEDNARGGGAEFGTIGAIPGLVQ